MLKAVSILAFATLSISCDSLGLDMPTEVRVENQSPLRFEEVEYYAGNELVTYQKLEPGENTPYVDAGSAYGYTTVQVVVAGDTLRLQVIDYVGEEPLGGGRFTYVLSVDGPAGSRNLLQQLRRDS